MTMVGERWPANGADPTDKARNAVASSQIGINAYAKIRELWHTASQWTV